MNKVNNFEGANSVNGTVFSGIKDQDQITVLVVDDEPELLDLTATFLEKERDEFAVETFQSADVALSYIEENSVDAIVSDYDMPKLNGLDFLERVREKDDVPFILFTGKGSEEIASEAISRGVTDYLQKQTDTSQYSLLANRIINSVEKYRASKQLERSQEKFSKLVTNSSDVLGIVDENARFKYISPVCEDILGYEQHELIGSVAFSLMPPEDREQAMNEFFTAVENPDSEPVIEHRWEKKNGEVIPVETRGTNMFDDDFINGFVVNGRDISEIKKRQKRIEQQNERLTEMHNALSHDIKSPLQVALNSLVLYREQEDKTYLDKVEHALERIDVLVEQILTMTKHETTPRATEQIALQDISERVWKMTETENGTLEINGTREFKADQSRLQQVLQNLFENAIKHSEGEVTISVGTVDDGIYVEDTGPGIPENKRSEVFESGYTTKKNNTGLGLNIVKQIIEGHGWDITVEEGSSGGARFEITGITFEPQVHN